jgi:hypothetical protein
MAAELTDAQGYRDPMMPSKARASPKEVTAIAGVLPDMAQPALDLLIARRTSPIVMCLELTREALGTDLTGEAGSGVRRRFNGFYGVRRNAVWRDIFYAEFERLKSDGRSTKSLFEELLKVVHERTGRTEASFVSKAIATFRPESPIIDSIIRLRLGELVSAPAFGGGIKDALGFYEWLLNLMKQLSGTPEAVAWGKTFDGAFAHIPGAASIHMHRKLDFLIWGARSLRLNHRRRQ